MELGGVCPRHMGEGFPLDFGVRSVINFVHLLDWPSLVLWGVPADERFGHEDEKELCMKECRKWSVMAVLACTLGANAFALTTNVSTVAELRAALAYMNEKGRYASASHTVRLAPGTYDLTGEKMSYWHKTDQMLKDGNSLLGLSYFVLRGATENPRDTVPDYCERCPKSVMQTAWYYDAYNAKLSMDKTKNPHWWKLQNFIDLEKAGFDQIPCGTNWIGHVHRRLGVNGDDVMGLVTRFCRANVSPDRLKGFLMAPCAMSDGKPENLEKNLKGIDLFKDALADAGF